MRKKSIYRKTHETEINLSLNLDGKGNFSGGTGIGFFDHMLEIFTKHSGLDLSVEAKGDLHVDFHHTVEDVGITLGEAVYDALGDKNKITRYGFMYLPMDEALVRVSIDLSGRPFFVYKANLPKEKVGDFDSELVEEFLRALAYHAKITLHVEVLYGTNTHHIIEAIFKGLAHAFKKAIKIDEEQVGIPSTKGKL